MDVLVSRTYFFNEKLLTENKKVAERMFKLSS